MNLPTLKNVLDLLRRYKIQKSYTDAQLATNMTTNTGWTWTETHITNLMEGRANLTDAEIECVKIYLLNRYYYETLS